MIAALAWIVGILLICIGGIHAYWMLGGRRGGLAAVPSDGAKPLFRPTPAAAGVVAAALACMGWFVLELGNVAPSELVPERWVPAGGWALAAVFILRAVGEFRWVGFTKRKKGTLFAKRDTLLYSPLCLAIGVAVAVITVTKSGS